MKQYANQTVVSKTSGELINDINKIIRCFSNQHRLHKKYDIGEDYDRNEFFELSRLQSLLCNESCEIAQYETKIKNLIKTKIAKYGL